MEKMTLVYLKSSGDIVASHVGEEKGFLETLEDDRDFLRARQLKDTKTLALVVEDVDEESFSPSDYYIAKEKLTRRRRIELTTNASDDKNPNGVPEIAGDGHATCEIEATIYTAGNKVDVAYSGDVRFSTPRGKLSAKNGIAKAKQGVAKVVLTSAPETVAPFKITALAAGCLPGTLQVEFY
jgi:hypothetical protein